jgi:hypothetical protein
VPLCLERAGAVPLAVDITIPDINSGEDTIEPLLPHTSRIAHLRLVGHLSIEAVANDLPGFFDSPMLSLASLELEQTQQPVGLFPTNEAPVPPVFQNVSNLKSLRLTRTPLYPALLSITSLRELKLLEYISPFDFRTFIEILRSNLLLENLVLNIQFIEDTIEMTPTSPKVSLSHLRHLSITCSKQIDSKGLLSRISLLRGVHIEVKSIFPDEFVKLRSFLPSPITPILELLGPITIIKSRMTPRELNVIGNSSTFTFHSLQNPPKRYKEFTLFPTAAVREFHVDIHPMTFANSAVLFTMGRLPALETLAISNTTFPAGLLEMLTKEPIMCPVLKTIAFLDCDIDSGDIEDLAEAIAERRDKVGARLYRVVIVSSTVPQLDAGSVEELRRSVPCVEIRVDNKFPDLS